MQSRLTLHTFPARLAATAIALLATFAVGDCVGYALKQPSVVTHTITRTVGLPTSDASPGYVGRMWIGTTLYTNGGPGQPWQKQTPSATISNSDVR
jgi:hypothetical protein